MSHCQEPPVRVRCCVCSGLFTLDELYVDDHKDRWDMCRPCGELAGGPGR